MHPLSVAVFTLSSIVLLPARGLAHGGVYSGPGAGAPADTVPPSPQGNAGGSSSSVGPSGGTTPRVVGGSPTSSGRGAAAVQPRPSATGGIGQQREPEHWTGWWDFNRHSFLRLGRDPYADASGADFFIGGGALRVPIGRDSESLVIVRETVAPALLRILAREEQPDIVTGCLIALARLNEPTLEDALIETFSEHLRHPSQEIRETAALSIGILGSENGLGHLIALASDNERGRELRGGPVDLRSRAFAAYGLGLLGAKCETEEDRRRINQAIVDLLPEADRLAQPDLATALVISIGLVPLQALPASAHNDPSCQAALSDPTLTRQGQIAHLIERLGDESLGTISKAHVPAALGRLVGELSGNDATRRRSLKALLELLNTRDGARTTPAEVRWGVVQVLGHVVGCSNDPLDVEIRRYLLEDSHGLQRQGRLFALMSMAEIAASDGDSGASDQLLSELKRTLREGSFVEASWAALALGTYGRQMQLRGRTPDAEAAEFLLDALEKSRSADATGAFSIAIGLYGAQEAQPVLLAQLDDVRDPDHLGHVALGLGMLGNDSVTQRLRALHQSATYRPGLLRRASLALGLLNDSDSIQTLLEMLETSRALPAQAALTSSIGLIGDRRALEPLLQRLEDEDRTDLSRAFTAAALGLIADGTDLPWNAELARGLNYRAALPTLNDADGKGILNLL